MGTLQNSLPTLPEHGVFSIFIQAETPLAAIHGPVAINLGIAFLGRIRPCRCDILQNDRRSIDADGSTIVSGFIGGLPPPGSGCSGYGQIQLALLTGAHAIRKGSVPYAY
jgi:hypothetical protein